MNFTKKCIMSFLIDKSGLSVLLNQILFIRICTYSDYPYNFLMEKDCCITFVATGIIDLLHSALARCPHT